MNLYFLENAIQSGLCPSPDTGYKELNQAFISQQWENTTALRKDIEEQDVSEVNGFENFTFHKTEAWLNYVVGQTSSGVKNGDDFVQLTFENINHPCIKGRYYKFDNNYWLGYFTNEYDSVDKSIALRRCNNYLKIIDPIDGKLYSIPCVVGYDMSAPSSQVSRYVITPNNHATVLVQGNKDTVRLFKTNTRFILGGRPFKLYGQQNAIYDSLLNTNPTILYLDLFLDEIHDKDDIINSIADNGDYNYTLNINFKGNKIKKDSTGIFDASVLLNEKEVPREIVWESSSKGITVSDKGEYTVVGEIGEKVKIKAYLFGNIKVFDEIEILISEENKLNPTIIMTPDFKKIRQYESIEFNITAIYDGVEYKNLTFSEVSLSQDSSVHYNDNISINKNKNKYILTCENFIESPLEIYISVENDFPSFETFLKKQIQLVNMFE